MDKRRLLFVDDEPNLLDGLKRMLRSMRKEFEFCFAENAQDALKMMEQNEFDVVISDMRMPGMDGADLLTEVQKRHPHSIRIMLTGQADEKSTLRTIGVVHQFLAKPCDPEKLKSILLRASSLHRLMIDGKLKDMISSIDTLPSLPSVYEKLLRKIREPEASLDDIGELISRDIAMTAKILHLVNSAFFGLYKKVESPARAVKLLGLDTIKALVLISQIFSDMKVPKDLFSVQTLWKHSMTVGKLAKMIAESETDTKDIIDNSYIAGVLHDIGKLILVFKMEAYYREAVCLAQKEHISLRQAEKKIFKATHCDMGAYLIGLWGFQSDIVEAIGFHHQLGEYPADTFSPALAVHIANVLYYRFYKEEIIGAMPEFNEEYLQTIGMGDKLKKWQDLCFEYMGSLQNSENIINNQN
ncbi:MAG: response regulator [Desulfocapsaceae bacterium]|nr:response regulator [Desulfocapsaceae bacterium]